MALAVHALLVPCGRSRGIELSLLWQHTGNGLCDQKSRNDPSPVQPAEVPCEIRAPPRRLERPTNGLGRRSYAEAIREVERLRGLILDSSRLAGAALEALGKDKVHGWVEAIRLLGQIAATAADAHTAEGDVEETNLVRFPAREIGRS